LRQSGARQVLLEFLTDAGRLLQTCLLEEKTFMKIRIDAATRRKLRMHAGFTLIEILLVIVILLLLASALVVFLLPQQEGAERNTTRLLLSNVATALDTYRLNIGRYPSEQDGGLTALMTKPNYENPRTGEKWQGPYLKPGTRLEDPWGNPLRYEFVDKTLTADDPQAQSGPPYKLFSIGPDGQPETDDDIKLMPDETDPATEIPSGTEQ
jgi:general secretion pathway protein G